jgi:hypothetical protein
LLWSGFESPGTDGAILKNFNKTFGEKIDVFYSLVLQKIFYENNADFFCRKLAKIAEN